MGKLQLFRSRVSSLNTLLGKFLGLQKITARSSFAGGAATHEILPTRMNSFGRTYIRVRTIYSRSLSVSRAKQRPQESVRGKAKTILQSGKLQTKSTSPKHQESEGSSPRHLPRPPNPSGHQNSLPQRINALW